MYNTYNVVKKPDSNFHETKKYDFKTVHYCMCLDALDFLKFVNYSEKQPVVGPRNEKVRFLNRTLCYVFGCARVVLNLICFRRQDLLLVHETKKYGFKTLLYFLCLDALDF